ncbi:MAG: prolipoprotein diacylglyceryl transferase [Clostridiales bacterium]|nr:prolipoprotein diacylglyceryl transferase [Clostridiales bacterium]
MLYVVLNFSGYRGNLLSVFAVHQGGLAFHGAVFAGVIVGA